MNQLYTVYKTLNSASRANISPSEGKKIDIPGKCKPKESQGSYAVSEKIDLKSNTVKRDRESHSTVMKGLSHPENITIKNVRAPNIGTPKYVRQILTDVKGTTNNAIIVEDFNIPLSTMDGCARLKNQQGNIGIEQFFRPN